MNNTYSQFVLIIISVLLLSVIWEFGIEDSFFTESEPESFYEKIEYIVTIMTFVIISLIIPLLISTRLEKRRKELVLDRENIIYELNKKIETIKRLEGVIPICAYCKKIRDDEGAWFQLEQYIQEHSEAQFSHGICPNCHQDKIKELHIK